MPYERPLFPRPIHHLLISMSWEDGYWTLRVRTGGTGEEWLVKEPDTYERCTLGEAGDVIGAVLDGVCDPTAGA